MKTTKMDLFGLSGTKSTKDVTSEYRLFLDDNSRKDVTVLPKDSVIVVYSKGEINNVGLGEDISKTKWDDTSKYNYAEIPLGKGSKALEGIVEHLTGRPYFIGVTTSKGMDVFHDVMEVLVAKNIKAPKRLESFLNSYKNKGYNCLFGVNDLESKVLNIYATVGEEKISEENKLNLSQIKEILEYCPEIKVCRVLENTLEIKYLSAFQPNNYDVKFTITGMDTFRELSNSNKLGKELNKKDLAIIKVIEATSKNKEF